MHNRLSEKKVPIILIVVKKKMTGLIGSKSHILFLVVIIAIAVRSFFTGGFVPTHDGEYHIIRLWQFDKAFTSGTLFPRWAPNLNNGYGVPLFSFFYPLPNYIGEFFHLLGFSLVSSVQLALAFGLVCSALAMYLFLRLFAGKWQATTGAIFYLLAPYHLVDVFVRGSVGEVWALALIPLVLLFTTRVIRSNEVNRVDYLVLPVSAALLLMSHNIIGVLFYVIGFLYGIVLLLFIFKKARLRILLKNYLYGLLLTAFFWIPIIVESKYVTGLDIINVFDHFVDLFQLVIPSWGTGFSVPGVGDQISFQLGMPHVIVLMFALILQIKKNNLSIWLLLFVSLFVSVCMTEVSAPLWRVLPLFSYFQFPWRLLSLTVLTTSVVASFVTQFKPRLTVSICILLALAFYMPYTHAVVYEKRTDDYYLVNPNWINGTATLGNTFNTIWFQPQKQISSQLISFDQLLMHLDFLIVKPNIYIATVDAQEQTQIDIHQAFFPGWIARIDGRLAVLNEYGGLMRLRIPAGKHSIIVKFAQSPAVIVGSFISFVVFNVMLWAFFQRYENSH